jgi:hypothetical protein
MTFVCHLGGSDRAAEKGTFFFFHGWGRFKACRRFNGQGSTFSDGQMLKPLAVSSTFRESPYVNMTFTRPSRRVRGGDRGGLPHGRPTASVKQ